MKSSYLFAFVVCVISAIPHNNWRYDKHQRFIDYVAEDGINLKIDLEAEPDMKLLSEVSRNPANNQYLLYTRRNPNAGQTLSLFAEESVTTSHFNPELPTVVIVHGWRYGLISDINPTIRTAYLDKIDCNVIVMDWTLLALADYTTASFGAPAVGRALGDFLNFLHDVTGAPFESMHLIGFCLGAHIVGNAGRQIGGRAARVTGLDPAGPLWHNNNLRISESDGIYVEGIHTDGGVSGLGFGASIGHADFFPNGGISQPGCLTNYCSHNRAWQLFASSVTNDHLIGRECNSALQLLLNTCNGQQFPMGNDDLTKSGSGMYRLDTRWIYPY